MLKSDQSSLPIKNAESEALLELLHNTNYDNLNLENSEPFHDLLLRNLVYTSYEDYSEFVTNFSSRLTPLPDRFESLAQYQLIFMNYIEIVAHLDIQAGWELQRTGDKKVLSISEITLCAASEFRDGQIEFRVVIKYDLKSLPLSMQSHLQNSIIMLCNNKNPKQEILCISHGMQNSKSDILELRFVATKTNESILKSMLLDSKFVWHARYITSIIDRTRSYAALCSMKEHECLLSLIQGNITLSTLPEKSTTVFTEDFNLNKEQKIMLQHALEGNDKVNILHGPPGTGKTKTLAALIDIAVSKNNSRILVSAPSNQAIGELATRLFGTGIKILVIGDKAKLPESLRDNFLDDFSQRLCIRFMNIIALSEEILSCFSMESLQNRTNSIESGLVENTLLEHDSNLLNEDFNYLIQELDSLIKMLSISEYLVNEIINSNTHKYSLKECLEKFLDAKNKKEDILSLPFWLNQIILDITRIQSLIKKNQNFIKKQLLTQPGTVYFATPSTIGRLSLSNIHLSILEEAGQITEDNCAAFYAVNTNKLILAGDPKQLSPFTLFSKVKDCKYDRSPLDRLSALKVPMIFLPMQYRMKKILSDFISKQFYNGKLVTSINNMPSNYEMKINGEEKHIAFVNTVSNENKIESGFQNIEEAKLIARFIRVLRLKNPEASIGVISFYVKQSEILDSLLANKKDIIVSSVDKFQGGESDFIIISGTRSDGTGFLKNPARFNVALSRARDGLYVFGHRENLSSINFIKSFIKYTKENNAFYEQKDFNLWLEAEERANNINLKSCSKVQEAQVFVTNFDKVWGKKLFELLRTTHQKNVFNPDFSINDANLIENIQELENKKIFLNQEIDILIAEKDAMSKSLDEYKCSFNEIINNELIKTKREIQSRLKNKSKEINFNYRADMVMLNIIKDKHNIDMNVKDSYYKSKLLMENILLQEYLHTILAYMNDLEDEDTSYHFECIAAYGVDPVLRSALFCRLSYLAFYKKDYWEAIFFARHVGYFDLDVKDNTILENRHYSFYQELAEINIKKCFEKLIETGVIKDNLWKSSRIELLVPAFETNYMQIVSLLWICDQGDFHEKIIAVEKLISVYKNLNYRCGLQIINYKINYLNKMYFFREVKRKSFPNEKEMINNLIKDFQDLSFDFKKTLSFDFILNNLENIIFHDFCLYIMSLNGLDNLENLKLIKTELEKKFIFDIRYLVVCYKLAKLFHMGIMTEELSNLVKELKDKQDFFKHRFDSKFLFSWILYQNNIFRSKILLNQKILDCSEYDLKLMFEIPYLYPNECNIFIQKNESLNTQDKSTSIDVSNHKKIPINSTRFFQEYKNDEQGSYLKQLEFK